MNTVVLAACFLPLAIIYVIMKLAVWLSATNAESTYVKKVSLRSHSEAMADAYADVDEQEEEYWNITED